MAKGLGGVGSILGLGGNCHEGLCCPVTNPLCIGINSKTGSVPMYPPGTRPRGPRPIFGNGNGSGAGSSSSSAAPVTASTPWWAIILLVAVLLFWK